MDAPEIKRYELDCGHHIKMSVSMATEVGDEFRCQACATQHKVVHRRVIKEVQHATA